VEDPSKLCPGPWAAVSSTMQGIDKASGPPVRATQAIHDGVENPGFHAYLVLCDAASQPAAVAGLAPRLARAGLGLPTPPAPRAAEVSGV
jgi:hypothetical protein